MPHLYVNTPALRTMSQVTEAQKQRLEAAWAASGGKTPEGAGMERLGVAGGLGGASADVVQGGSVRRRSARRGPAKSKLVVKNAVLESGARDDCHLAAKRPRALNGKHLSER